MGEVYRAVDTLTGQQVAVKVLPVDACRDRRAAAWREVADLLDLPHDEVDVTPRTCLRKIALANDVQGFGQSDTETSVAVGQVRLASLLQNHTVPPVTPTSDAPTYRGMELVDDPLIGLFAAWRAEVDSVPFAYETECSRLAHVLLGNWGHVVPTSSSSCGMCMYWEARSNTERHVRRRDRLDRVTPIRLFNTAKSCEDSIRLPRPSPIRRTRCGVQLTRKAYNVLLLPCAGARMINTLWWRR